MVLLDWRNKTEGLIQSRWIAMKESDSQIFTSSLNYEKPLRRESITSHSFRVGYRYITQLWKDTGNIEFVRQAVGHIKVQSPSTYVENLPNTER